MGETRHPDDLDIMAILTKRSQCMTYVIRNCLCMDGLRCETPWVLRRMKRMEREGKVMRVPTSYATMICWSATPKEPPHA